MTSGFGVLTTSADSELSISLSSLRSRSRQLLRDSAYAKRARVLVQNNVIGTGVGMQAQVRARDGSLSKRTNDEIEKEYCEWSLAKNCHTGGQLHFADLERAGMAQVFDAGEVIIRLHFSKFGDSKVPLALELIESERMADEFFQPSIAPAPGTTVRMGVEVDKFFRPQAYWVRNAHPGDIRFVAAESFMYERVPADQIFHLRIIDRWPQTRGEPWLHNAARKLFDMDGLTESELFAARASANVMFSIEQDPSTGGPLSEPVGEKQDDGSDQFDVDPGVGFRLEPGQKLNMVSPNRPNAALDPFMRMMLREFAAGTGPSYESISRDYSQSNYSSSRLALLDDRDLWRVIQLWWIRNFRMPLHRIWMQQAVLAQSLSSVSIASFALDPRRFAEVQFKPRGWSWIDPAREVDAYKEAIKGGLTTRSDVIAQTANGLDREDIDETRATELEEAKQAGLVFDTDPQVFAAPKPQQSPAAPAPPKDDAATDPPPQNTDSATKNGPPLRAVSFPR